MKTIIPLAVLCALPSFASADACLTGTWQADLTDIAEVMARQMGGSAAVAGGNAIMVIDAGGRMDVSVNDVQVSVTPPGIPTVDVSINGYSRGVLTVESGRFDALVADYRLVGSSMVLGQRMDIPFDSTSGMFGTAQGSYICDEDTLMMEPASSAPQNAVVRKWRRIG